MLKLTVARGESVMIGETSRVWVRAVTADRVTLVYEGQFFGGEQDGQRVRMQKELARFEPMACGLHLVLRWTSKGGEEVRLGIERPEWVEVWKE
jgi:sRNA-binding carbon storage regulator CsrA